MPSTVFTLNLRYSPRFGRPFSNQTHDADGVGALRVRDVEADERARHRLEAELSSELVDRITGALVGLHR